MGDWDREIGAGPWVYTDTQNRDQKQKEEGKWTGETVDWLHIGAILMRYPVAASRKMLDRNDVLPVAGPAGWNGDMSSMTADGIDSRRHKENCRD